MYHSITFGDKNTWDDWHLVPSSRPVINPPAQKTKTLDVPGADGVIDLSTSLTGYPVFKNRTGSIEFYVMNDYDGYNWIDVYSSVMAYIHGKTMRMTLEDDPDYFYEGRFEVNTWKSDKNWSKITINYDVNPYKWSWESSLIQNPELFYEIPIGTTSQTFTFDIASMSNSPICPTFIVDISANNALGLQYINQELNINTNITLRAGETKDPQIILYGENSVMASVHTQYSTGTLSIDFHPGRL